ncbi:MAG: HDOD domain-containing protein [Thermodesulfobacteriota bacterium]
MERASTILENIREFSTLPTVYSSLIDVLADPKSTTHDVSNIIACDQASTMKVLKVVNSPFYGFSGQIDTVSRAIVILGFTEIYHLILASYIMDFFSKRDDVLDFRPVDFWGHSIAVGIAARLIGQTLGLANQENFFVTGVLHDIGKLVFFEFSEDRFAAALALSKRNHQPLQKAEKTIFGLDHCQTGALLTEKWRFPTSISEAIRHHQTGILPGQKDPLTASVHLGNILCRALELGYPGDDYIPQPNPRALEIIAAQPDLLKKISPALIKNFEETVHFLL